jgi:hypothetical protein
MLEILNKIGSKYNKAKFSRIAKKIRNTAPTHYEYNEDIIIVSQVYHAAVDMTLVALKSFLTHFGEGAVEILDDGSLTEQDYALFRKHIPHVKFHHINDVDTEKCPKGSCWERLTRIIELTEESYVIQVDTDTLTIGQVQEVYECAKSNQAFTIGSPNYPRPISTKYLANYLATIDTDHVQTIAEQKLHLVNSLDSTEYIRGCAAFTGFPRGSLNKKLLQDFSVEMETLIGKKRWHEWGSEQFASNVMISICDNPKVLPWPKYQNFGFPKSTRTPNEDDFNLTSVFHFIGSNRFDFGIYSYFTKKFIGQLGKHK